MTTSKPDSPAPVSGGGLSQASQFWDGVLDPDNLDKEGKQALSREEIEREIAFADTPDVALAARWLREAPDAGRLPIMDLGAGLGAHAFLFARMGLGPIIVIDTSPARLAQLAHRADILGLTDHIWPVQAAAEALPLAEGALAGAFTKSVLIHTDLPHATREIHRTLATGGHAALVEPLTGNPMVNLYRGLLAPKEWAGITRYFDADAQQELLQHFPADRQEYRRMYVFSFVAFGFQFALPWIGLRNLLLRVMMGLDRLLTSLIPPLNGWCWFGINRLRKKTADRHDID